MTTPSVAGLTVTKAVVPLISRIKEEDKYSVTLQEYVEVGVAPNTRYEKRKFVVPGCKSGEPEALLRTITEFIDVCGDDYLALTHAGAGPRRFIKFRECLGGPVRDAYDVACADHVGRTLPDFNTVLGNLVGMYVESTALADQRVYFDTVKKPYRLNVAAVGERLRYINRLMRWFPGQPCQS